MKHEWRKKEKSLYLPKNKPVFIDIPEQNFLIIDGEGNPNSEKFALCIQALYSLSYSIKMNLKKKGDVAGQFDYTVYPLEGIWDLNEEGREKFNGNINKDDLVFRLMIRQPDFVTQEHLNQYREEVKKKKPNPLLDQVVLEKIIDGPSIQMMHIGSFDSEPASFRIMEKFAMEEGYERKEKSHREIYLSDFRKVPEEKLKTVLRFQIK